MLLVLMTLSANFSYQNYQQALQILEDEEHIVSAAESVAGCDH